MSTQAKNHPLDKNVEEGFNQVAELFKSYGFEDALEQLENALKIVNTSTIVHEHLHEDRRLASVTLYQLIAALKGEEF